MGYGSGKLGCGRIESAPPNFSLTFEILHDTLVHSEKYMAHFLDKSLVMDAVLFLNKKFKPAPTVPVHNVR